MTDDLVKRLRELATDQDMLAPDNTNDSAELREAADRIEALEAEMKLVMEINERLLAALRSINSRLSDDDSWLAQSIDCRNIAEAALEKKNGNKHD